MGKADIPEQVTSDFKKDIQPSIDAVMKAYKTASENENKTTYSYILLGKALLNCRMVLRSAFKDHITFEKTGIADKQVKRYMKLVACPSCYDDLSKKPNTGDNKKLILDPRIDAIKEDDLLNKLQNPSMNKLVKMKETYYKKNSTEDEKKQATEDFNEVMQGNEDKYAAIIKKEKEEKEKKEKEEKEKKEKALKAEYLKTGLTKEEYELYKAGGDAALKKIQKVKNNEKWLKNQVDIRERKITALRLEVIAKEEELSDLKKPKDDEAQDAA